MTAFFVLVPGFLQSPQAGFGLTPTQAGLILLPFSLAMIAAGPIAGRLGTSHGRTLPLRIGLALGALSLAGLATLHGTELVFALWMPIMGTGMAFALAAIGALVIDHSEPHETGVTSAMNTIMRTTGAAIGAQLAATILVAHDGQAAGYTVAFAVAAAGALLALVPTLLLSRKPSHGGRDLDAGRAARLTVEQGLGVEAGARGGDVQRVGDRVTHGSVTGLVVLASRGGRCRRRTVCGTRDRS